MPALVEDAFIELPDRTLRVRRVEPADGPGLSGRPTLVFLHEGLGSIEMWREFPQQLCELTGCPGLVYDRTGYGRSSGWPAAPGIAYMTIEGDEILPRLLGSAAIDHSILVGHSDGGTIALNYASLEPDGLVAVVTIGAHVVNESVSVSSIARARLQFLEGDLRSRLERYHGDNVDRAFWLWNSAWLSPGFEPMDARARLPRVRVPVLALQGALDEYGTRRQLDLIAAGVAGSCETQVLPGCGHSPHRECPGLLLDLAASFVSRAAGTSVVAGLPAGPGSRP